MSDFIKKFPKLSFKNKEQLQKIENACCYFCQKDVIVKDIKEWTDDGETAICPHCNVDAVVPMSNPGCETLLEVKTYWFG